MTVAMTTLTPGVSRLDTWCRIFAMLVAFVAIVLYAWAFNESEFEPYDNGSGYVSRLGFGTLFISGACLTFAINTLVMVFAPAIAQYEGKRYAGWILGCDCFTTSVYIVSIVFNSWPTWEEGNFGPYAETDLQMLGLRGLLGVFALNCILFVTYLVLIGLDSRLVHRKRMMQKYGRRSNAKGRAHEPSIEMPSIHNAHGFGPAESTARIVPSVKSNEGASSVKARDMV